MVGRKWKRDRGWFKTALQESVPSVGWQRGDGKSGWPEDPLLRVDGDIHKSIIATKDPGPIHNVGTSIR